MKNYPKGMVFPKKLDGVYPVERWTQEDYGYPEDYPGQIRLPKYKCDQFNVLPFLARLKIAWRLIVKKF